MLNHQEINFMNNEINNENTYCDSLMKKLRAKNVPSIDKKLKRYVIKSYKDGIIYDKTIIVDDYYMKYINDVLSQIRKGKTEYLHQEYQIKDILRFEPNIKVSLESGIFSIELQ